MKSSTEFEVVRRPAVAGMFYPDDPVKLRRMVDDCLAKATVATAAAPKALIAPHAGYVYSGPIAGSAFVHVIQARNKIRRVILLGPSHRWAFEGLALSRADAFATPLGFVPVDQTLAESLVELPQVQFLEKAHEREHALEVELPFLQAVLDEFSIVPLVVGNSGDEPVTAVIERLWGGTETLIVISSDLSHYYDYATAQKLDRATAEAIEQLRPERIGTEQACGRLPIRGLLGSAKRRGLRARTIDLRNSGDTAGTREEVVGYGAFLFTEN